ncbi:MAG TPA: hypothetical protein VHL08_00225 [Dongiaceae bacterium]|jgi:hypothetical protein|nr:hypothetical protein [Dongiaceae bacterium]
MMTTNKARLKETVTRRGRRKPKTLGGVYRCLQILQEEARDTPMLSAMIGICVDMARSEIRKKGK